MYLRLAYLDHHTTDGLGVTELSAVNLSKVRGIALLHSRSGGSAASRGSRSSARIQVTGDVTTSRSCGGSKSLSQLALGAASSGHSHRARSRLSSRSSARSWSLSNGCSGTNSRLDGVGSCQSSCRTQSLELELRSLLGLSISIKSETIQLTI